MSRLLVPALVFLTALPAAAGDIVGYVANDPTSIATYDRFPSGIGSPTPNAGGSFVGAGLDLSGIGWRTDAPVSAITLFAARSIADPTQVVGQYIVGAAHVGLGSSVTFADNAGVTHTYSVAATQRLTTNGVPSDVLIGRLSEAVSAAVGVRPLPLANLTPTTAIGVNAFAYGQNPAYGADRRQLGLATIGAVQQIAFGGNDSPTIDAIWQQNPNQPGSMLLIGGDSGGPLFTRGVAGETALIGAHMGVDTTQLISASSFLPNPEYVQQINDFMLPNGFQVVLVPVPEPAGLLAVAAVGAVVLRRLRRLGSPRGS